VYGERYEPPVGSGAKLQPSTSLVHFENEGKLLVAFKMHGFTQQKMAFLYIFMKKISKSFHSVVTLL